MDKKLFLTVIIILISMFISLCDDSPSKSIEEYKCEYLYPIKSGNYWKYSKAINENKNPDTMKIFIQSTFDLNIEEEQFNAGIQQNLFHSLNYSNDFSTIMCNTDDGVYSLGSIYLNDTITINPILKFKYPVELGDKWEFPVLNHFYYSETQKFLDTTYVECIAENFDINTPVDTFSTIVYYYSLSQGSDVQCLSHYFYYFSPGFAMVALEIYSSPDSIYSFDNRDSQDLNTKYELIDYNIDNK
ncbi:MAG: hypothetical protein JXQ65_01980 [Candidatus Marinimicrobia bacterium]|nr:hypothetical protein [Candidatus Neomarinimicrobiota bacterium]